MIFLYIVDSYFIHIFPPGSMDPITEMGSRHIFVFRNYSTYTTCGRHTGTHNNVESPMDKRRVFKANHAVCPFFIREAIQSAMSIRLLHCMHLFFFYVVTHYIIITQSTPCPALSSATTTIISNSDPPDEVDFVCLLLATTTAIAISTTIPVLRGLSLPLPIPLYYRRTIVLPIEPMSLTPLPTPPTTTMLLPVYPRLQQHDKCANWAVTRNAVVAFVCDWEVTPAVSMRLARILAL